ncbi:MAG: GNAT family N-acetyltransferase [Nocardioides sp.]
MRTTLPDRPGSLATLSRHCGERGVNILGLQIFPGIGGVTDELVLRAPDDWTLSDVAELIETAGGTAVTVGPCTEHALVDGPTRYLQAVLQLVRAPHELPQVLAWLLDAETAEQVRLDELEVVQDRIDVLAGPHRFAVSRTPEFTASEHARASAFAEVAEELLAVYEGRRVLPAAGPAPTATPTGQPAVRLATVDDAAAFTTMHQRCSADTIYRRYATPLPLLDERLARRLLTGGSGAAVADVEGELVGVATVSDVEDGVAEVTLLVEDGWQRRGIGTRLLATAARLARARGARDVVLRSRTHNAALTALAFGSGMRARIRLSGDTVLVTIGVETLKPLKPLEPVPAPAGSLADAPA